MDDKLADRVRKKVDGNKYRLEILNVMELDSGIYIAHASNSQGSATCTAQLVVEPRKYIIFVMLINIFKNDNALSTLIYGACVNNVR